jgi:histidinol-phosphatase (PHP family)
MSSTFPADSAARGLVSNLHTHSEYCDGRGSMEEFIDTAHARGIRVLGFSSHAAVSFDAIWTIRDGQMSDYIAAVRAAARYAQDRYGMAIFAGFEADYIESAWEATCRGIHDVGADFIIAAVHVLGEPGTAGYIHVTSNRTRFGGFLESSGRDVHGAVEEYYRLEAELVCRGGFDILAHMDIIKKINFGLPLFDEASAWYRRQVEFLLHAIAKRPCVVELNTGGLNRGKADDLYPAQWILAELALLRIPVTVTSDAHTPGEICGGYEAARQALRTAGYAHTVTLGADGWVELPL